MLVLLFGCTTSTLTKTACCSIQTWKRHSTKQQLYSHLSSTWQTYQVRWTGHAGHCWRSKDQFISNLFLWTPTHRHISMDQLAWTDIHQVCVDTGYHIEDLLRVMLRKSVSWLGDVFCGHSTDPEWLVFAIDPGDCSSNPGKIRLKTQKMVLDTALLSTQHYKVQI